MLKIGYPVIEGAKITGEFNLTKLVKNKDASKHKLIIQDLLLRLVHHHEGSDN